MNYDFGFAQHPPESPTETLWNLVISLLDNLRLPLIYRCSNKDHQFRFKIRTINSNFCISDGKFNICPQETKSILLY